MRQKSVYETRVYSQTPSYNDGQVADADNIERIHQRCCPPVAQFYTFGGDHCGNASRSC